MHLFKAILRFLIVIYWGCGFAAFYPPVAATGGMVVSDHYLASAVGAQVLKQGGNAMDAAVAVGYALAVVHPCCGNIGGGGFMLIHWHTGENIVLDFREVAPQNIRSDLFFEKNGELKSKKELGYLLVAVPGTVMGLNTALKKYGTWSLQKAMTPAVQLAQQGFVLNDYDVKNLNRLANERELPGHLRAIFRPNGHFLRSGQRLIQEDLARTLQSIRQGGTEEFYQGDIAKKIVAQSDKDHGVLSLEDFKNYHIVWRKPIHCHYRGYTILTAPPPSAGVAICEILEIVEGFSMGALGFHSAAAVRINAAAMKQAFYDRNHYLGDPQFVHNPLHWLLAQKRIRKIQRCIRKIDVVNPEKFGQSRHDPMYTTHFVVMDHAKNVVNTTYTINSFYGAMRMADDTGFFLNDELHDFALRKNRPNIFMLVQGKANLIRPGKRPLSSMSPTLVMRGKQFYMALGAAGGPTIITTIAQAIENVIDFGMNIRAANDSARYHMQWKPDVIYWEPYGFSPDTVERLKGMGYILRQNLFDRYLYWGQLNSLSSEPNGIILGASDNRLPNGSAVGVRPPSIGYRLKAKTFATAKAQILKIRQRRS